MRHVFFVSLAIVCSSAQGLAQEPVVASTDGVKLYVKTVGNGPPVVVVHGGPGLDHGSLLPDLEPLTKTHRLVFYDQRGGGRSTLVDAPHLGIDDHVADLESLREHLGLEKVTLLAHSFGPGIAAKYAIAHPSRVERMIFLGPIPPRRGRFVEEYGAAVKARLSDAQRARMAELLAVYKTEEGDVVAACREYWEIATLPRVAKGADPRSVKADLCTAPAVAIRFGMMTTNEATFASLGDWDWREALAAVKAPTLVIHGEEDMIPAAMVREWTASLPNARVILLPKTGHFPHAEKPQVVFPAIEEFLRGSWPKGAT